MNENYRENFDRIFRGTRPKPQEKEVYSCIMEPQKLIVLKSETLTIEAPIEIVRIATEAVEELGRGGALSEHTAEALRFQYVKYLMDQRHKS